MSDAVNAELGCGTRSELAAAAGVTLVSDLVA